MTKSKNKAGKSRQNKGNDNANSTAGATSTKKSKSKPKANDKNQKSEQNKISCVELQMLQQIVLDFLNSDQQSTEMQGLTNIQRKEIHVFAWKHGLKTRSRSSAGDRVLCISRKEAIMQHIRLENVYLTVTPTIKETLDKAILEVGAKKPQPAMQTQRRQQVNRSGGSGGLVVTPRIPPHPRYIDEHLARERRDLPIYEKREKIFELLEMSQVLIVNGATGSGKSTQLPQYLLEHASQNQQAVSIVVSQPRRIAAITVSGRIAEERGESLGDTVGYIIRMESKCSNKTLLSLTTSGCLFRSLAMNGAELFANTTHLVIDEVHDRDLNTDFLLLTIKLELERNKRLKLILMSATMDLDALSTYFGNAPVLDVEGRSFNVRIYPLEQILLNTGYMTPQMKALLSDTDLVDADKLVDAYHLTHTMDNQQDIDNELIVSLLQLLLLKGPKGAVIVYLPGYQDMIRLMDELLDTLPPGLTKIFMLHSQVDTQKQKDVFHEYPNIQLKIVLSTNIGQTSITILDLLYVIDTGRFKMKIYDTATGASQLNCVWISQADAQQRAGRVGRRKDGICYRLYSTEQFNNFTRFIIPEIMRHTLEEICLLAKIAVPQQPIEQFLSQALDPPQPAAVTQAVEKLKLLHVLQDDNEMVTHLGYILAELPLDVQLGKCVVYSIYYGCLGSMIIIAAFYSVRDPFVLPTERNERNAQRKTRDNFCVDGFSDSLGILQLYADYVYDSKKGRRQVEAFCEKHFVCQKSMDMFVSAVETLRITVRRIIKMLDLGAAIQYDRNMNMIRLALTAGLYPSIAYIDRNTNAKRRIVAEGDSRVQLSRNSGMTMCFTQKVSASLSDWLLFVEKTRTSGQVSNIGHVTLVNTLMVAIQCGKVARLEAIDPIIQMENLMEENCNLNRSDCVDQSVLCIDNWIRITLDTKLGKQLLRLRSNIAREFHALVTSRTLTPLRTPSVVYVEKLLELNAGLSGLSATDIVL